MDDRNVEVYVFEAENGAVAKELEDTHAVFDDVGERTHVAISVLRVGLGWFVYGGNVLRDISKVKEGG